MSEPITSVEAAVRELGALPMPAGPEAQALSAERLAEIAARADAATAGPWCTDGAEIYQGTEYIFDAEWIGETCRVDGDGGKADAVFVAHARADVPALLVDNERLLARVAELEAERHSTNEALDDAVQALRLRNTQRGDVAQLVERERQCNEECVAIDDVEAALMLGADETGGA